MALPEQIRRQTAAVQELYKQLNPEGATGEETSPADVNASAASNPPADRTSESDSATPSPVPEQKAGEERVPEETLLQKYKTLQGMYNAEVPRMHQQNRDMQQRIQHMEQLLASVSQQSAAAQQPQSAQKLVSDKDVEEYGESLDVMRRVSREELNPIVGRLSQIEDLLRQMQTSVVPQVQAVAQRQQVSAEQMFWADLTNAAPNWRDINDNADFQSWLLETDPLTGITRQTYLEDAQRGLDARRVSNFFLTWLEKSGQASVAQSTERGLPSAASELEKQVSPGRSRSTGTSQASKERTYTPDDIKKFFNDVRAGKYKGRDQDRARLERDIFAAQREGRIQLNA